MGEIDSQAFSVADPLRHEEFPAERQSRCSRTEKALCIAALTGLTFKVYFHHNVILMIGEFEYLLIASAARLGDDAYGAAIRREMEEATGKRCSIGALYTTLGRLESKGLVKTWMGESTPERGGRAKRMVRVTAKGLKEATAFYRVITRISRDASWEVN